MPSENVTHAIETTTKADRLRLLADSTGRLAVLAIDHRGNLRAALSRAAGREVDTAELVAFKRAVVRLLSSGCSAVLLDPEYGLAAAEQRAPNCGLLLAYEKTGYDELQPGRRAVILPHQSVTRLQDQGAQAIKFLLHYSGLEDASINDEKMALVERVGAECSARGLPFFLEIITYDPDASSTPVDLARRRPAFIGSAVCEFSRARYGVDVLKLELPFSPGILKGAWGSSSEEASRVEVLAQARDAFVSARQPVVFLSGGVSVVEFQAGLEFAAEAGIPFHGVLCGRAVWNGAITAYAGATNLKHGESRLVKWLEEEGRANLDAVCSSVARYASPLPPTAP